jgi:hypothetical protein
VTPFGKYSNIYVREITDEFVYLDSVDGNPITCFYTVYAERKDIDKLNN